LFSIGAGGLVRADLSPRDAFSRRLGKTRRDTGGCLVAQPTVTVLDAWIKKNEPAMSRPEAIRRLVELGLKAKVK
jgi:hypothetical protein